VLQLSPLEEKKCNKNGWPVHSHMRAYVGPQGFAKKRLFLLA
jgi:hypothetical protein